jgi:hypothetical protein
MPAPAELDTMPQMWLLALALSFLVTLALQLSTVIALFWAGRDEGVAWRASLLVLGGEIVTVGGGLALASPPAFLLVQAVVAVALAARAAAHRTLRVIGWGQLALAVVAVALGALALDRVERARAAALVEFSALVQLQQVRADQLRYRLSTSRFGTLTELRAAHGPGLRGGSSRYDEAAEVMSPDASHWAVRIAPHCEGCRSFYADETGVIRAAVGRAATTDDPPLAADEAALLLGRAMGHPW